MQVRPPLDSRLCIPAIAEWAELLFGGLDAEIAHRRLSNTVHAAVRCFKQGQGRSLSLHCPAWLGINGRTNGKAPVALGSRSAHIRLRTGLIERNACTERSGRTASCARAANDT